MLELRSATLRAEIAPHGARLVALAAPDRDGRPADVVVGPAEHDLPADDGYFGAIVGRYANRIAGGSFTLDGRRHLLSRNESWVTLHGGVTGFDHAEFVAEPVRPGPDGQSVTLRHTSPDGDNGFPGTLWVTVTYAVRGAELSITIGAAADAATVVNLTNHAYLNLRGSRGGIDDHEITLFAEEYLPVDGSLVPTGALAPVAHTPFDLRKPARLGDLLGERHPQLVTAGGFDHCYVLHGRGPCAHGLPVAAHVREPGSGRTMTLYTDQPGVQFYTGNLLDGRHTDRAGAPIRRRSAFCLEPQHFPDSPNHPQFPSTVLRPGQTRVARSVLRFGDDDSPPSD